MLKRSEINDAICAKAWPGLISKKSRIIDDSCRINLGNIR